MIEEKRFVNLFLFSQFPIVFLASFTFVSTFYMTCTAKNLYCQVLLRILFGTNAFAGIEPLFKIVVAIPCLSKASEIALRAFLFANKGFF